MKKLFYAIKLMMLQYKEKSSESLYWEIKNYLSIQKYKNRNAYDPLITKDDFEIDKTEDAPVRERLGDLKVIGKNGEVTKITLEEMCKLNVGGSQLAYDLEKQMEINRANNEKEKMS